MANETFYSNDSVNSLIPKTAHTEPERLIVNVAGHVAVVAVNAPDPDDRRSVLGRTPPKAAEANVVGEISTGGAGTARKRRKTKIIKSVMGVMRVPSRVIACVAISTQR